MQVKPVSMSYSRTGGQRASDALVGGLAGPFAIGMQQGLRAQEKAAAAQEWTSWKQWTLSHVDFPVFKEMHIGPSRNHNNEVDKRLSDPVFVGKWKSASEEAKILELSIDNQKKIPDSTALIVLVCILVAFSTTMTIVKLNDQYNEYNNGNDKSLRIIELAGFVAT